MPQETPPGYTPAGTVTVTIRFAARPFSVRGLVLRHEECGGIVAPAGVSLHERLGCPEAAKEGT